MGRAAHTYSIWPGYFWPAAKHVPVVCSFSRGLMRVRIERLYALFLFTFFALPPY